MLSKSKIKIIQSLHLKKFRQKYGLFIAEGDKLIHDLLNSTYPVEELYVTSETPAQLLNLIEKNNVPFSIISKNEIQKLSHQKSPQNTIGILKTKYCEFSENEIENKLCLALDSIQDPGNMGTILRLCSWFNIEHILCSSDSVDIFNIKVIQGSMGAFSNVKVMYCELNKVLHNLKQRSMPIYGTFMEGENIYTSELTQTGIIVFGNEGNGISGDIEQLITSRITIPSIQSSRKKPESLNVAIATSIVCSEFTRRIHFTK